MLKKLSDEEKFQKAFSAICDSLNIETLVPIVEENDISDLKTEFSNGYWKNKVKRVVVCPQPFYLVVVTPDGTVLPCCECGSSLNVGKISRNDTIVDIWNGKKLQNIRSMMIDGKRFEHPVCSGCNVATYQTAPEDNLDDVIAKLHRKYDKA